MLKVGYTLLKDILELTFCIILIFTLCRQPLDWVTMPVYFVCTREERMNNYRVSLFLWRIPCGFPSPADDYVEAPLDLNELVIAHPAATFFVRVSGDSMINAAICDGDIIVVDRSQDPRNNSIVVAYLNGEFTVKRLSQ